MKEQKQLRPTRRTHSLGGCEPCKRRHKKCDQALPTCSRCLMLGNQCERLSAELYWMPSAGPQQENEPSQPMDDAISVPRTRRLVESHQSRMAMCKSLVADIPETVDAALYDLEEKSKHVINQTHIGPFGVLNLGSLPSRLKPNPSIASPSQTHESSCSADFEYEVWPNIFYEQTETFEASLQWSDLFDWNPTGLYHSEDLPRFGNSGVAEDSLHHATSLSFDFLPPFPAGLAGFTVDHHSAAINDPDRSPLVELFADAPMLLKHYDHEALHQFSSLPLSQKSPWRILHIPAATLTLSELSMFGTNQNDIKNANLAVLYGLLAASSYHLSVNPPKTGQLCRPNGYWATRYEQTYKLAKHHLEISIQKESRGPNKVKYKEQVMAMNATMSSAFVSNNQSDIGKYLVELEKVIRYRGLAKHTISRRARFLHHIYAWVRIVSESTRVIKQSHSHIQEIQIETSGENNLSTASKNDPNTSSPEIFHVSPVTRVTLDDFFRLEVPLSGSCRSSPKKPEEASPDKDIHLTGVGEDANSLYMQIYGIPETWLRLLSQTTRLANFLDFHRDAGHEQTKDEAEASNQKSIQLEAAICEFSTNSHANSQQDSKMPHSQMLRALCSALVIYFYQRIRHVSPMILQGIVGEVIQALGRFDEAMAAQGVKGTGTSWPAFIAGSESMSPSQRRQIMTWVEAAIDKTGFNNYKVVKDVLQEVWRRRDEANSTGSVGGKPKGRGHRLVTWMEVCKDMHCWPILC